MKDFKIVKKLKDIVLLRYLDEVDLDSPSSIYEVLLRHLFSGDLDNEYTNEYLEKLSDEDKKTVLRDCEKYSHLCLIYNDYSKFDESVNSYVNDGDLILLKILENFDFIFKIYMINKDILEELSKYENNLEVNRYSVIEVLREDFSDDNILIDCLNRMVIENKYYDMFSCERRSVLYDYPLGLLYIKDRNTYKSLPIIDVATFIYNYVAKDDITSDEVKDNPLLVTQISKFVNGDLFDFKETIRKISDDYYTSTINV